MKDNEGVQVLSIEDLVRGAQEGRASCFGEIYQRFFDSIYRYVSFKIGDPWEAEDLTEGVFLRALESIRSFKWKGYPFSSWLYRIAHNLVVDHFRRKSKDKRVPLEHTMGASYYDLDQNVEMKLTMQQVHRAMAALTEAQKEVISLRFAGGLSVAETARAVGKGGNAVKALQHAALLKLRRSLQHAPLEMPSGRQGRRPRETGDETVI